MSSDTAQVLCRHCRQPLDVAEQKVGDQTLPLVTCWNREGKCRLCGYTFTLPGYFTRDLSAYRWRKAARL